MLNLLSLADWIVLGIFFLLLIGIVIWIFIQKKENTSEEEVILIEEIVPVSLSDFEVKAEELVGKQVMLSGTVDHVCKHGGQRMFVIETGSEGRVKLHPTKILLLSKQTWRAKVLNSLVL